jgi:hypothetical protein
MYTKTNEYDDTATRINLISISLIVIVLLLVIVHNSIGRIGFAPLSGRRQGAISGSQRLFKIHVAAGIINIRALLQISLLGTAACCS